MKKKYYMVQYEDVEDFEIGCNAIALDGYVLDSFADTPETDDFRRKILAVFRLDEKQARRQGNVLEENIRGLG